MKSYKNIYNSENEKNISRLYIGKDDNANKETIVSLPIQSAECSDEPRIKKEIDDTDAGNISNDNKNGKPCKTVDEDMITISDDEEVIREPSRFAAPEGFGDDEYVPRYKSVRSYYGKDEACFIMDARVRGNIGRYLNHSCSPNVFVQNVFVDTHDPRFPWVAFFALDHIRAGTELTWNYNYDVGSVPGKVIYCRCGASNCRGRLL